MCGWSCPPGWTGGAAGSGAAGTRPARPRWRCWHGCGPEGRRDGRGGDGGDWLAHWLVSRTSPAASTVRGYAAHVRLYLGPYLGQVLLTELTVGQVQAMFTAIIRQHQALGTPVSAATLTRIRATLRAALNAAIRRGLIPDNPAARAELPRARRPRAVVWTPYRVGQWRRSGERPPVAVWTVRQTAQFLDSVRWHRLYAAYHLVALRGLRRGEAAGLRWCDVDLDGKTAVISQQLQQYDGRLAVCPPKTPHSVRVIALDRTTADGTVRPRKNIHALLMRVRAFYLDIQQRALETLTRVHDRILQTGFAELTGPDRHPCAKPPQSIRPPSMTSPSEQE